MALRANLESMEINKKNENGYDVLCTLLTPDKETPETVESLVRFSEKADAVWQHSPDGKNIRLLCRMYRPEPTEAVRLPFPLPRINWALPKISCYP